MPSGAEPAYRGYRVQALYTLHRMLCLHVANQQYQPEGQEDLAIYGGNALCEVVQVKQHGEPLTISAFHPERSDSFFNRTLQLLRQHPNTKVKIVSFGPIGTELDVAVTTTGAERNRVAKKLESYGFMTAEDATHILSALELEVVVEAEMYDRVHEKVRASLAVPDAEAAFDLLMYWLYRCAEHRKTITPRDLQCFLTRVGRFVAQRAAHHLEWFTSIQPIEDTFLRTESRELANEFYSGVSARYEHVLAGLDVKRPHKLELIRAEFKHHRIVILSGASGQGKSTLAYRFLHDEFPELWRFQIQVIENRAHALRIALALAEHADALELPMAVYIDVKPQDTAWLELVGQISQRKNIRVLVTVRSEDLARANLPSHELDAASLDLSFDQSEARLVYERLVSQNLSGGFLDFAGVWERFGGQGPLLEFIYLVTQGDTLRSRLQTQVHRLKEEVRRGAAHPDELKLLRLVSVAGSYSTPLPLMGLLGSLKLPEPQLTLEFLENEYLIRQSAGLLTVEGLHPLRSRILAEFLTDGVVAPWPQAVAECIVICDEVALGAFLCQAMADRPEEAHTWAPSLSRFSPASWSGVGGCVTALLWLGVHEYVRSNLVLIHEIAAICGTGWQVVLDCDLAGAIPDSSMWDALKPSFSPDSIARVEALRGRQTPKHLIFTHVTNWLASRVISPRPPASDADWASLAETSFWISHLGLGEIPLALAGRDTALLHRAKKLPLELGAEVLAGLWGCGNPDWSGYQASMALRFQRETGVPVLEDDGHTVKAHFVLRFDGKPWATLGRESKEEDTNYLHGEAIYHVHLMRNIWPDREVFSCAGYGNVALTLIRDQTIKHIARRHLPTPWLVNVNATFLGVATYALRPRDWNEARDHIIGLRDNLVALGRTLLDCLLPYLRYRRAVSVERVLSLPIWQACKNALVTDMLLPQLAVDPWGVTTEDKVSQPGARSTYSEHRVPQFPLALDRYRPWITSSKEFFRAASALIENLPVAVQFHLTLSRLATEGQRAEFRQRVLDAGINLNTGRLAATNLDSIIAALPRMQAEFRQLFSGITAPRPLKDLERREEEIWHTLHRVWTFIIYSPDETVDKPSSKWRRLQQQLADQLEKCLPVDYGVERVPAPALWEGQQTLWFRLDSSEPGSSLIVHVPAVAALWQECHAMNDLERAVLQSSYSYIGIIPTVAGKVLERGAWIVNTLILCHATSVGDVGLSSYMKRDVPLETWLELDTVSWAFPRLDAPTAFLHAYQQVRLMLDHFGDLTRMPEITEDQGAPILDQYLHQFGLEITRALQLVIDGFANVANEFTQLDNAQQLEHPSLFAAGQLALQIAPYLLKDSVDGRIRKRLSPADARSWAQQLQTNAPKALSLYSSWVTDALPTNR